MDEHIFDQYPFSRIHCRIPKLFGIHLAKTFVTLYFIVLVTANFHKDAVFIIMTDADVDGAHIATLMLTFLYRFMPELIRQGYVYLAQPPLYKIEKNKNTWYAYSDEELNSILVEIGRDQNVIIERISLLTKILSSLDFSTFNILPRSGRIACVARERAVFAEPPAESPSTI